jgi:RNA polymerase sigma factor (sigma-70 family)
MSDEQWLAERFEEYRPHLRSVAYRMLGSLTEADDAVQDTWIRVGRAGTEGVDNLGGWLTTIVARVSLNMLRSRNTRREDPMPVHVPDPLVETERTPHPEEEAVLADSIGLALLVVLDTLSPAERLAFVLHDMFDLPFDEIATVVGRSPESSRQLASRARRRVRGAEPPSEGISPTRQREVVDAVLSAARGGDLDALVDLLHPGIVLRIDAGTAEGAPSMLIRGADAVAQQSRAGLYSILNLPAVSLHPALVNGAAGIVVSLNGDPISVMGFTISEGKIVEIDSLADPVRLERVVHAFEATSRGEGST